jgi:hypothetical protein
MLSRATSKRGESPDHLLAHRDTPVIDNRSVVFRNQTT